MKDGKERYLSFKTRKLENGSFNEQRFKRCGMKNYQEIWASKQEN